jgi:hypothetical protein
MNIQISPDILRKAKQALFAAVGEYADDDYEEGDSWSIRLCREAPAAIQAEPN